MLSSGGRPPAALAGPRSRPLAPAHDHAHAEESGARAAHGARSAEAGASAAGDPVDLPAELRELRVGIGQALERLDALPDVETREVVFGLLEAIDTLHRDALGRLLGVVEDQAGAGLLEGLRREPVVRSLLELYDLLPPEGSSQGDPARDVKSALLDVHSYVESHGGHLEVLRVEGGLVHVRLSGSCEDCPGSSVTLRRVVEQALREHIPWFTGLVVDDQLTQPVPAAEAAAPNASAPETGVGLAAAHAAGSLSRDRRPLRRPRWVSVARLEELREGELRTVRPEDASLLLVRLSGEVYAYADGCPPESMLTLRLGEVDGVEIVCPWHGCRYDARTGRRTDGEGRLAVFPVALQGGEVRIALGTQEVQPG